MRQAAISSFICAVLAGSAPLAAAPTERIGSAVQVVNQVRAEYETDRRELRTGDDVHQDEIIEVGDASIGELILADDTKLALGPGARLLLDKFVYDGKKSNGDIVLNLVKGTFRFITGVATKNSYRIRTPAAAITVRGTIFDVFIDEPGAIWLLLMEGGIRACNDVGTCRNLDRPGQILRISPRGEIVGPTTWARLPGRQNTPFETAFPFVVNAPGIDPNPTLSQEAIVLGRLPTPPKAPPPAKPKRDASNNPPKTRPSREPPPPRYADNPGLGIAIGIGVGIGIGKMIGGRNPGHSGGGRGDYPGRGPGIKQR